MTIRPYINRVVFIWNDYISYGRANFTNLGRYSQLSERTYRRQYQRSFNFMKFNQQLIKRAIEPESPVILAVDCSFIPQ